MSRTCSSHVAIWLAALMLAPSMASGQQTPGAASQTLATIAADHAAKKQANRQTILNVLDRQEVRKVAKGAGLSIEKVASAVATLDGTELAAAIEQAKRVEDALAGGGKVMTALKWTLIITALIFLVGFLVGMAAMSAGG